MRSLWRRAYEDFGDVPVVECGAWPESRLAPDPPPCPSGSDADARGGTWSLAPTRLQRYRRYTTHEHARDRTSGHVRDLQDSPERRRIAAVPARARLHP